MLIDSTEIVEENIAVYDSEDTLVCITNNQATFDNIRLQITQQSLEGFYIIFRDEKIRINSYGNLEKYPKDMFCKHWKILESIVKFNREKRNVLSNNSR